MKQPDTSELIARIRSELAYRDKYERFRRLFPDAGPFRRELYAKHVEFFNAGATFKERIIFGGNRTGKIEAGGYEATCHATGIYPDWWTGKRFYTPTSGVASGKSGKVVRDTVQVKLLGFPVTEFGSGMIPKDLLIEEDCKRASGTPDLYDIIAIRHSSGGRSIINLKSYDQGREAFEGTERHWIWEDEEADQLIHGENVARTMTVGGIVYNTYTPLKGQTELTMDFEQRSQGVKPTVFLTRITWDDAPHITPEMQREMEGIYKPHEMLARKSGIPKLGSGAIFTVPWEEVSCPPRKIEPHWPRAFGMDFGWVHPTAAIWGAWDRDNDVLYCYSEHRRSETIPAVHAVAIQHRGAWIRGASDASTNIADGRRLIDVYKGHGLHLIPADKSLWGGIEEIQDALALGKLKFFNTLHLLREEYESYQTDEKGKIVEKRDDLLASLRYLMSKYKSIARTEPVKRRDNTVTAPNFGTLF